MSVNGVVVLAVPARLTWDEWVARVKNVAVMKRKLPFYIGDLLLYGEQAFGEKASQLLNDFGNSDTALTNFKYVSKKFPPEERCDLPWSWHQAAAGLPKKQREKAITDALAGLINRSGIRALANGGKVNGAAHAENGSESTADGLGTLLDALGLALETFSEALVTSSKLTLRKRQGEAVNGLLAESLDELISAAQNLKENLNGKV
jgi:hypothetical protein